MTRPLSLIVSGPLLLVLGALLYQAARTLTQWLVRRDAEYGWAAAWCVTGATFVASRLTQRVLYASDEAVTLSVFVQVSAAVTLLPISALASRAVAGRSPSFAFAGRLLGATFLLVAFLLSQLAGRAVTDRVDLFGEPLRALRFGPGVLALTPLVAWTTVDCARTLRSQTPSDGGELALTAVAVAFGILGLNDALLAAGVLRTIQVSHFGVFFVMAAAGYVFERRLSVRQEKADEALAAHTHDLEVALEAGRASEARFKMLAEATVEGVIVHEQGQIRDVNMAAARLLGHDSETMRAQPVAACFDEPRSVQSLLDGVERGPLQARARKSDGSTLPVEVTATRGPSATSQTGILSIRDLTERDDLHRRLAFADRMASLGTLAAGAAHEINNPLAYVSLNLDYLGEQLKGGALSHLEPAAALEVQTLLVEARAGCDRISKVVQELRTLSRQDDGASPGPVDLSEAARGAVKMAIHEIRLRARVVETYGENVIVLGTEARLLQVCLNLIINATQALPDGHADGNEVRVTTRRDGATAVLEVTDTGSGIPREALDRIFDPFYTTKPVGTGTGLGLSICHTIVTGLGGRITVDSAVGKGTTFRVTFPGMKTDAEPSRPTERPPTSSPTGGRILIVDDEIVLARALARALKGAEVTVVTSGTKAIGELEKQSFDVILCDLTMSDTGGVEVFEYVQKTKPELASRFVLMTGGTLNERAKNVFGGHASRALLKPIDVDVLRRTVNEVLRRK